MSVMVVFNFCWYDNGHPKGTGPNDESTFGGAVEGRMLRI